MKAGLTIALDGMALALVRGYRLLVSPAMPPACRFHPSCSAYAEEAVRLHGWGRGALMALGRLIRCQPLSPGGYDPVPPAGEDPPSGRGSRVEEN